MIVALVALFVALGGSSYAAIKIGSGNIKRGAVNSRAIANNSVRSSDVRNSNLTGRDVKNNSLTNADIVNSNLTAKSADTGQDGDYGNERERAGRDRRLGFHTPDCTSQSGALKGFARINASAGFSGTFTTTGVENPYNCSGGTVEAQRLSVGTYVVRFNGASPVLALVDILDEGLPTITSVSTARVSAGSFRVQTVDTASASTPTTFRSSIATLSSWDASCSEPISRSRALPRSAAADPPHQGDVAAGN